MGPFHAGPNLKLAVFMPALILPVPKFALTPFRAMLHAIQKAINEILKMLIDAKICFRILTWFMSVVLSYLCDKLVLPMRGPELCHSF